MKPGFVVRLRIKSYRGDGFAPHNPRLGRSVARHDSMRGIVTPAEQTLRGASAVPSTLPPRSLATLKTKRQNHGVSVSKEEASLDETNHLLRLARALVKDINPDNNISKTVIVTGSSRGIGKAIALRLAHDGYDVCVNDVPANRPGCEEVAKEIQGLGRKACVAVADVSKRSEVAEMIQTSVKELGELNVMIANAGIAQVKSLIDLDDDAFQQLFNVNCTGVHNCYTEAAKQLIKQGNCTAEKPGKLIAASSIVGYKAFAALGHYSASKWWVRGYNQASAMEYADKHITCNTYAPGIAATAMWELIDEELGKDTNAAKGDTMQKYVDELIALKRPSTGEDVSKMVSFLASGDSDYCTGQSYLVDGGIIYT